MSKILFRGQTRRKGEKVWMDGSPVDSNWVYGGIFPQNNGGDFAIIYQQEPEVKKFTVYADTVCPYIGLDDKNGNKVFEDDIVIDVNSGNIGVVKFGIYNLKHYGFYIEWRGNCQYRKDIYYWINNNMVEVIGNIFDNPELIEGDVV